MPLCRKRHKIAWQKRKTQASSTTLSPRSWTWNSLSAVLMVHEVQNHRMVGVGRDLCGSSSPSLLLKQGHLQQAAEDLVQAGTSEDNSLLRSGYVLAHW